MKRSSFFGSKFLKKVTTLVVILIASNMFLPVNIYAKLSWPYGQSTSTGTKEEDQGMLFGLDEPNMQKIDIPGFKISKTNFTLVGKEIFDEFLKIENFDLSAVRQLLNRHAGSKFYHLYSAYCYGFYMWQKTTDPYQKERIKRAVWNIAMEFSLQNEPKWRAYFFKFFPIAGWTFVAILAFFWGAFLRKNNQKIFEKCSDKLFDGLSGFLKILISRDNGKSSSSK